MSEDSKYQVWADESELLHEKVARIDAEFAKKAEESFKEQRKKIKKRPRANGLVVLVASLAVVFWLKLFHFVSEGDVKRAIWLIVAVVIAALVAWLISKRIK